MDSLVVQQHTEGYFKIRFKGTKTDINMVILGAVLQKTKIVPSELKYYKKFHFRNKSTFILEEKNLTICETFG